ncbi:MAG: peptidoglycan DD-metalloendopeptidase family protein [Clostridia bacterium]|nr:peptidoglycan DD-metalloendopeptidase family protein [Clostridia bacterium]
MTKRRVIISVVAIFLVAGLLFGLGASILQAFAAKSDEIKDELSSLQDEADNIKEKKQALQEEINATKSETKDTVQRKSEIDRSMELTREEITNTESQIRSYNKLIAAKQDELDTLIEQEQKLTDLYQKRLRNMEEGGTKVSYWAILFKSTDFSDLLERIDMIQEIEQSDRQMLENLKESARKIAASREDLAKEKLALEEQKDLLAAQKEELNVQREKADKLLIELNEELSELEDTFDEYEQMEDSLVAQIAAAEAEYQAQLERERAQASSGGGSSSSGSGSSSGSSSSSSGGFLYPLPAGTSYVSCAYGYRIHPITGNYSFHSGVDLAASTGTPIYASKSGYVSAATYTYVYGNYVTITHDGGYSTLYGHMDYSIVSPQQYVEQGQIIGYVGSTGWSTGSHLHFTIYQGGSTVNPMNYVSVR